GIEHEGAVIIGVVMRAQTRLAIVLAAGGDGRAIERIDLGAGLGGEGDMDALIIGGAEPFADPEERLAAIAETDGGAFAGRFRRHLHNDADTEWGQRLQIKLGGAGEIAEGKAEMVDHPARSTIFRFKEAIALAGFSPLGQALVQFMMV